MARNIKIKLAKCAFFYFFAFTLTSGYCSDSDRLTVCRRLAGEEWLKKFGPDINCQTNLNRKWCKLAVGFMRTRLLIINRDITKLRVDAIVNAANTSLLGGGGVDGAIHVAAGSDLLSACKKLNGCKEGEAKITDAYGIKQVKKIIHTVGPQISGSVQAEDRKLLRNCYYNALELAKQHNLKSIAFPCISAGVYSFPSDEASKIAIETVLAWLRIPGNTLVIDEVVFCVFNDSEAQLYRKYFEAIP